MAGNQPDESGVRLFEDNQVDELKDLPGLGTGDVKALVDECLAVCQLNREGFDDAKKESTTPSDSSPTA